MTLSNEFFCYGKKCEFVRSSFYPTSEQSESIPIKLNIVKSELPQVGIIFALNLLAWKNVIKEKIGNRNI